ncbi:hypothetical protein HJC23_013074 [Cyclotella cryptica]|uniref:Uncharacterized protein n=1 Tax=Cyclotella cryptica TaxID=29204 RepID=A0ABD3Q6M4_9STRA
MHRMLTLLSAILTTAEAWESVMRLSKSDKEESFLAQANISSLKNFLDGMLSFESGSVLGVNLLSKESSSGIFAETESMISALRCQGCEHTVLRREEVLLAAGAYLPTSCFTFMVLSPVRIANIKPCARGDPPPHGMASSLFLQTYCCSLGSIHSV